MSSPHREKAHTGKKREVNYFSKQKGGVRIFLDLTNEGRPQRGHRGQLDSEKEFMIKDQVRRQVADRQGVVKVEDGILGNRPGDLPRHVRSGNREGGDEEKVGGKGKTGSPKKTEIGV